VFTALNTNQEEIVMTEKFPYVTNLDVKFKHFELIDIPTIVRECKDTWFNQTLTKVNDRVVRIGIVRRRFAATRSLAFYNLLPS
jgi:hypothetical protein